MSQVLKEERRNALSIRRQKRRRVVFLGLIFSNLITEVPVMAEAVLTGVKITPLGDRILVRPTEKEETRKSGIIIPDTAKEKPQEGKVVAVGTGKVSDEGKVLPILVKVGEKVIYGKYSGTEIKLDDVDHLILGQDDILAIVSSK
jgi:chaperonin GroES